MKRIISMILVSFMISVLAITASAADLSGVMPAKNAGEDMEQYCYENHITNLMYPDELKIEFDLTVNGPINNYATIFCFHNGDGNARFVFTLGGGMFFNNWAGSWFDAGLHEGITDNIFEPYIGSTVHVKMTFDFDKFELYLDDNLAYDSNTLVTRNNAADAFYGEGIPTDYMTVSSFICMTSYLDFGYNSWWTNESLDAINAEIADFSIYFDNNLMAKYFVGSVAGENEFYTEADYAVETEAPETEAPETEVPETEAPETEAPVTEAPETEAPAEEKGGCSSSASIAALVIVSALGCAIIKKH